MNLRSPIMVLLGLVITLSTIASAANVEDAAAAPNTTEVDQQATQTVDEVANAEPVDPLAQHVSDLEECPLDQADIPDAADEIRTRRRELLIQIRKRYKAPPAAIRVAPGKLRRSLRQHLTQAEARKESKRIKSVLVAYFYKIHQLSTSRSDEVRRDAALASARLAEAFAEKLKSPEIGAQIIALYTLPNAEAGAEEFWRYDSQWEILGEASAYFLTYDMPAEAIVVLRRQVEMAPTENTKNACRVYMAQLYVKHGYDLHAARELYAIPADSSLAAQRKHGEQIIRKSMRGENKSKSRSNPERKKKSSNGDRDHEAPNAKHPDKEGVKF